MSFLAYALPQFDCGHYQTIRTILQRQGEKKPFHRKLHLTAIEFQFITDLADRTRVTARIFNLEANSKLRDIINRICQQ